MAGDEGWARLRADWDDRWKRFYAKDRVHAAEPCRALMDAVATSYASGPPSKRAELDFEVEVARWVLHEPRYHSEENVLEEVLAFWRRVGGLELIVGAVVGAMRFRRSWEHDVLEACTVEEGLEGTEDVTWALLRRSVGTATDEEYESAAAKAREIHRDAPPALRFALAVAFPKEPFFSDEDRRWGYEVEDEDSVLPHLYVAAMLRETELAGPWLTHEVRDPQLVDALGDDAVGPLRVRLFQMSEWGWGSADYTRACAEAMASIDTQAAFDALAELVHHHYVGPVAVARLREHPDRGIRALVPRLVRPARSLDRWRARRRRSKPFAARNLLSSLLWAHRDVAEAVLADLEGTERDALGALLDSTAPLPEADREALPAVLRDPPWKKKKKKKRPAKKKKAKLTRPDTLAHEERIDWGDVDPATLTDIDPNDPPRLETDQEYLDWLVEKRKGHDYGSLWQLRTLTDEPGLKLLREWPADAWYGQADDVEMVLARFGLEGLPPMIAFCKRKSDTTAGLARVDSPRIAAHVAHCYAHVKKVHAAAEAWLLEYPRAAAVGLIPELFDAKGKAKKAAVAALSLLATSRAEVLRSAAAEYGEDAVELLDASIAVDTAGPLANVKRAPKMPAFFDAARLPRPVLRGGSAMFSIEAVEDLGALLAIPKPGERIGAYAEVAAACDPDSLARFSWSLFQEYLLSGAPSKHKWAFFSLSWFGDAEAVRHLGPMIKAWAPAGWSARSRLGIDVLREMETDPALLEIYKTAKRPYSRALAKHAQEALDEVAASRGLTREDLADRLVPDLGLDVDGSRTFDYGRRRFRIGFDEHLKPFVVDDAGERRPDLPKPRASDEEELAEEARRAFKELKKQAKEIAKDRLTHLERAMVLGRRWPADTFLSFFATHPLVGHLARRLVWAVFAGDAGHDVDTTFRIAEDGTLADIDDEPFDLDRAASVGIVHPLSLSDDQRARWGDRFGDYEILQSFQQLGRDLHVLEPGERSSPGLDRWPDVVQSKKTLGLTRRGWRPAHGGQGGVISRYEKDCGGDLVAALALDPGVYAGDADEHPEQRVGPLTVQRGDDALALGDVDPIVVSELLRDLAWLTGS